MASAAGLVVVAAALEPGAVDSATELGLGAAVVLGDVVEPHCVNPKITVATTPRTPATPPTIPQNSERV
jgi:hypothetical protein